MHRGRRARRAPRGREPRGHLVAVPIGSRVSGWSARVIRPWRDDFAEVVAGACRDLARRSTRSRRPGSGQKVTPVFAVARDRDLPTRKVSREVSVDHHRDGTGSAVACVIRRRARIRATAPDQVTPATTESDEQRPGHRHCAGTAPRSRATRASWVGQLRIRADNRQASSQVGRAIRVAAGCSSAPCVSARSNLRLVDFAEVVAARALRGVRRRRARPCRSATRGLASRVGSAPETRHAPRPMGDLREGSSGWPVVPSHARRVRRQPLVTGERALALPARDHSGSMPGNGNGVPPASS